MSFIVSPKERKGKVSLAPVRRRKEDKEERETAEGGFRISYQNL